MFHYFNTITNTKGDSLPGWQVECVLLADGSTVVPIYADESSTPIVTVSGVANRAVADAYGNFDFFVIPGNYSLKYYDANGVYRRTVRYLNMSGLDATVPFVVTTAPDGAVFNTVALMAAAAAPINGQSAVVSESGRAGIFKFSTANLSASVTIDTAQGIYVAPTSAPTGATGAWVRQVGASEPWRSEWFGLPTGGDDSARIRSIEALRNDGRDVHFGAGTFLLNNVKVNKQGHWKGTGKFTVMSHNGAVPSATNTFGIATSGGTRFSHMRFTGLSDDDNADAQFPINVSPRVNVVDTPEAMEDFEFDHLWFDTCSTGIRVSYGGTGTSNDIPGTTWWTPKRVSIHDCYFNATYQQVVPEGHDIRVFNNRFEMPTGADNSRPHAHCMRVLGCARVTIWNNSFDVPDDFAVISVQMAGVDNGLLNDAFRNAADVTILGNTFAQGRIEVLEQSGTCRIKDNNFVRSISDTAIRVWLQKGSSGFPNYFGKLIVEGNTVIGYAKPIYITQADTHSIRIAGNEFVGNAYGGAVFDTFGVLVTVVGNDQSGATIKAPKFIEILQNRFILNPTAAGVPIQFSGAGAVWSSSHVVMRGNTFPEQMAATVIITGSGTADPKIDVNGTGGFVALSSLAGITNICGDNARFSTGFDAFYRTNVRAEQIVDAYPPTFA